MSFDDLYSKFQALAREIARLAVTPPATTAKAKAYPTAPQLNLVNTVATKIVLNAEEYDPGSNFSTTAYRFVAPVDGYYLLRGQVTFTGVIATKRYAGFLRLNGSSLADDFRHSSVAEVLTCQPTAIAYMAAGHYAELWAASYSGGDTVDIVEGSRNTYLEAHLISV